MGQYINNNSINFSHLKIFLKECFDKIFKSEIFATKSIEERIRKNDKSLNGMKEEWKSLVLESLDEASAINKDFEHLKSEYLSDTSRVVNIESFKAFIRESKSGYYYRKAKILWLVRSLLMIPQFIIILTLTYPKYICTEESINNGEQKFWISGNKHYKVTELEKYREIPLRFLIFIVDAIFTIYKFFALKNLERIKANICLIISMQLTKFICYTIILVSDFSRNYCESSLDDENLFYVKNNIIEKIMFIYDLL